VQVCFELPQPLLKAMDASGSRVVLLLLAATVSAPVPLKLKDIGVVAAPCVMFCELPLVIVMLGAEGLVTVMMPLTEADRCAPSVAVIVTVELPTWPGAGVTDTVQLLVEVPQVEGAIVIPAAPAVTMEAGIRVRLELVTLKASVPTPFTVNAADFELDPPTMLALPKPLRVGPWTWARALIASTRP